MFISVDIGGVCISSKRVVETTKVLFLRFEVGLEPLWEGESSLDQEELAVRVIPQLHRHRREGKTEVDEDPDRKPLVLDVVLVKEPSKQMVLVGDVLVDTFLLSALFLLGPHLQLELVPLPHVPSISCHFLLHPLFHLLCQLFQLFLCA